MTANSNEYMRDYMRARRRPDLFMFERRQIADVGSAIGLTQEDKDRRYDAEQGSRLLLERITALLERREGQP